MAQICTGLKEIIVGYSLEIKNRIFEEFYNVSFKSRVCLCCKILDSYMLFKGKEEIERLIRIDAGRVLLHYGLKLYSDVFAIPEETTEFDPPRSEYETVLLFRMADDQIINMRLDMVVDRVEKQVWFTRYTTNNILDNNQWDTVADKHDGFMLTFEMLSDLRKERV